MSLDEEAVDLYRNARASFLSGHIGEAEGYYRRLRAEHACELFYEVDLPEHLKLVHPVGTVLGRASYSDYLVAYNGASVGSNVDRQYPRLGRGVVLFPGARVLGPAVIGNNVWITANTVVNGSRVPDNVIVFPQSVTRYRLREDRDNDGDQVMVPDNYDAMGCGWRKTTRNVIKHYWGFT